jgi:hypothetical protein
MENRESLNPQESKVQAVLAGYLKLRTSEDNRTTTADGHLDEDSLAAFTEGNLSPREARPILSHLVDCSFCRHVTAELVRLDMTFAADTEPARIAEPSEPASVASVLGSLLSRIFGTRDGAVFAHNEDEAAEESPKEKVNLTEGTETKE